MTQNNETRRKILDIAFKLFGERGYHGVSTAEIAQAADVNKALIFYYFGSKKELYRETFKRMRERLFERIRIDAFPGISETEYIEKFIHAHISFLRESPEMVTVFIRELVAWKSGSAVIFEDFADVFRTVFQNISPVVKKGIENGTIRDIDPTQTVISILSLDIFFFLQKNLMGLAGPEMLPDSEKVEATREAHIIDLLMNGIREKGNV